MILYNKTKKQFIDDTFYGNIDSEIQESFVRETGHNTSQSEIKSWRDSMQYMSNVMRDEDIPLDSGIAIEYHIPQTSKRIDFLITGKDVDDKDSVIIIELKQWSEGISISDMDGVVKTSFFGDVAHPSYQAWSYKNLLEDYNSSVEEHNIGLFPCAYLHNYIDSNVIYNNFYEKYTTKAPAFLKNDAKKLQDFIKKYIKRGDDGKLLYVIENGKIRPSKGLADNLVSMVEGNKEFTLIDDQKVVYETAIKYAKESENRKNVMIVQGGPGTGKSVVAINLLAEYLKLGLNSRYVTKNSAPRHVFEFKLTEKFTKSRISHLFSSSSAFMESSENDFDALIIDEAHRLNEKSGLYGNLGDNQIREIIEASRFTIFFVDDDQKVTLKDIGEAKEIEKIAISLNANVLKYELASQFRCTGSDGYLAWLDEILQIKDTANDTLAGINYDFRVVDSPQELHDLIINMNKINNKSRMVAGYCWNWVSKNNPNLIDIKIDDYQAKWNLSKHGQAWIIHPDSVTEIGCIHTVQGLELDYVGVIIGPDFLIRNGKVVTDPTKRAKTDQSIKGWISESKKEGSDVINRIDKIIKNTYRTLMTRGMKGCYVYCTDEETREYFKNCLVTNNNKSVDLKSENIDGAILNVD